MAISPEKSLQEADTIRYIKQLMKTLEDSSAPPSVSDSLALSDSRYSSQTSQVTLRLPIPQARPPSKQSKYARNYHSPYKQQGISIRRIEASGRSPVSPEVSFENTLLQMTTSRQQLAKRDNQSPSRYMASASLMDRLQITALDRLREQARQTYQVKEKQRMQMTPRQSNERWADFLLRERKWEEERHRRQMNIRQQMFQQQKQLSSRPSPVSRPAQGLSRENLIRKVKRERSKLEQRLREVSTKPFKYKDVNIRNPKPSPPKPHPKWVVVSDPEEARFLVEKP